MTPRSKWMRMPSTRTSAPWEKTCGQPSEDSSVSLSEERGDPQPPQTPTRARQESQLILTQVSYSGPLPPPDMLEAFERALPGAANRILTLTEVQARHRRSVETRLVTARI